MDRVFVVGKLSELGRYADLGANFAKAIAFVRDHDLASLSVGRHVIDGEKCWANVDEIELVFPSVKRPEVHRRHFDIQIPLTGEETIGVARFDPSAPGSFDEMKDIGFYNQPVKPLTLKPGEFAIFPPCVCAHAPGCSLTGPRTHRKVVVKIRAV